MGTIQLAFVRMIFSFLFLQRKEISLSFAVPLCSR